MITASAGSAEHGNSLVRIRSIGVVGLVALLLSGRCVQAGPLNPGSFTSLGTLDVASGSITINTNTLGITGAATFNGGTVSQGGGNPEIAVFTFGSLNIGAGVIVNVAGSRPLALLSQGSMSIAGSISLTGGSGGIPTAGAAGAAGGFDGGVGGNTGSNGSGPGAGGGFGSTYNSGGAGYGGAGGLGDFFNSTAGVSYGDLLSVLQGGSGGGGGRIAGGGGGTAGGGGGGGGAIELGAIGAISLTSNVISDGGPGGSGTSGGGAGSGGGILIHAPTIGFSALSALGGNALSGGGGGGGGRIAIVGGSFSSSALSPLFTSLNGGAGPHENGKAGVLVLQPDLVTVPSGQSLNVGITSGQTGQTDPRIEMLPRNLTVQSGGTATLVSPLTWSSGSLVTVSGGTVSVNENTTFAAGSTLNWSSGQVVIASGRTLTFDGGVGTRSIGGGGSLGADVTLSVINGGKFNSTNAVGLANGSSTGTLLVDGSGSEIVFTSGDAEWATNSGAAATVTFSNGGVGTMSGVHLSSNGGASSLTLLNGGRLTTTTRLITGQNLPGSSSVIGIFGGTLTSNGTSAFRNGTVVDLSSGGLVLNNDATFSGSSTFTWRGSGVLNIASGRTLNIDGGFMEVKDNFKILSNGATLRITNGGSVNAVSSLRVGDAGVGTMVVDGFNSAIYGSGVATQWGRLPGDVATVTFSNSGVGSFDQGLMLAGSGGTVLVNLLNSATLNTSSLSAGTGMGSPSTTININGGNLHSTGTTTLRNGTTVNFTAGTMVSDATMTLIGNAQILLSAGGNKVLRSGRLSVANTSKIDLADNDMIIEGSTSPTTVRGYIQTGRNGGNWLGNGITASGAAADPTHRALGYALASDIFNGGGGTFNGVSVSASAVLVKSTYPGDANLDGTVNVLDLVMLANSWLTGGLWDDGDFDYSGFVDQHDLGLLAINWQAGASHPLGVTLEELGLPTAVPEPAVTLVLTILPVLPRHRRGQAR